MKVSKEFKVGLLVVLGLLLLFVGVNLFQSGLTQWCLMGIILKKLGLKSAVACKTS